MNNRLALLVATWFGCGYWPWGPGTAGSLGGLMVAAALHYGAGWPSWSFAVLAAVGFLPSVAAATRTAQVVGRKDPGLVVVDEVLGQWITLAGAASLTPAAWIAGFVLFRAFDIVKPWPVRKLESLPEGWGIVADDCLAGVYGAVALRLLAPWLAG